jgi:hypothetical protein
LQSIYISEKEQQGTVVSILKSKKDVKQKKARSYFPFFKISVIAQYRYTDRLERAV